MSGTRKILIVLPVCNPRTTLRQAAMAAIATGYDLLVVDGGKDDHCLRELADLPCRTMRLQEFKGKGAALLSGAEHAGKLGYDTMVAIDGDERDIPADIDLLVAEAEKARTPCVIIGARQQLENKAHATGNFWVRLECGFEIPDIESGLRLYPVRELLALKLDRSHCRYGFEIETVVKLAWSGIPIVSVPMEAYYRSVDEQTHFFHMIRHHLSLAMLHSRLILRRLFPWPHKKLAEQEPFPQKVYETISRNPLKVLREICREHTSPVWLAMAVWLGIFMGALPLLAIHTIAIIYVAHRLHMNKVAAVAASQFCMPPVVPVLCIQMGYYLRNGKLLVDFSWEPWLLGVHERLWEWLIGSLLVGPLLGLIGAIVMYLTASRLQHRKSKSL